MLRHALRALSQAEQRRNPVLLSSLLRAAFSTDDGERIIRIDRSGLIQPIEHLHEHQPHKEPETELVRHLKTLIRVRA